MRGSWIQVFFQWSHTDFLGLGLDIYCKLFFLNASWHLLVSESHMKWPTANKTTLTLDKREERRWNLSHWAQWRWHGMAKWKNLDTELGFQSQLCHLLTWPWADGILSLASAGRRAGQYKVGSIRQHAQDCGLVSAECSVKSGPFPQTSGDTITTGPPKCSKTLAT